MPDKAVECVCRLVETISLDGASGLRNCLVILGNDPAIDRLLNLCKVDLACSTGAAIYLKESAGIPDFGGEVAVALQPCCRHLDVAALSSHGRQGEAQRVGAILVDQVQRVHHIALGLRHLLALLVADKGMDVDIPERHFALHGVHAHHHHPGDPEEDDVETCDQNRAGVIPLEVACYLIGLVRPAKGRERPQATREPCVEHILVTTQLDSFAIVRLCRGQRCCFILFDEDMIIRPIPGGNPVAPPQLARNAPWLDVAHPFEIGL